MKFLDNSQRNCAIFFPIVNGTIAFATTYYWENRTNCETDICSSIYYRVKWKTRQAPDKLHTNNPNIASLVSVLGQKQLSVKELLQAFGLKNRENFLHLFLNPAIEEDFVKLLFPDKLRHPRQKYLLTAKGLELYQELTKAE